MTSNPSFTCPSPICPSSPPPGPTTVQWFINSFSGPCNNNTPPPSGSTNFTLGTLFYQYNYDGIQTSGSMTASGKVFVPTPDNCVSSLSGLPFLQISNGWNMVSSCCASYTLYLQTGTPPNTVVIISINNENNLSQAKSCNTSITVQNQSYYPVTINAVYNTSSNTSVTNSGILLPLQNTSITCGNSPDNTQTEVMIGPDANQSFPVMMNTLCTSLSPVQTE